MISFYALLSRMKYINRWGLMRNNRQESLSEHTTDVAVIAHALTLLKNSRFGGSLNPERAATLALFHDAPEILTGDLPTPVKYFSGEIKTAYKGVEKAAADKLTAMAPADIACEYDSLLAPRGTDACYLPIIKAADKISALIKCIEEENAGNNEFKSAKAATLNALKEIDLPEVEVFLQECLPAYYLTLDEQNT